MYNKETEHGKLVIALFSPLLGVQGDLTTLCSTLEKNCSSGIFVHLASAVVFWISGHISSNAGRS